MFPFTAQESVEYPGLLQPPSAGHRWGLAGLCRSTKQHQAAPAHPAHRDTTVWPPFHLFRAAQPTFASKSPHTQQSRRSPESTSALWVPTGPACRISSRSPTPAPGLQPPQLTLPACSCWGWTLTCPPLLISAPFYPGAAQPGSQGHRALP